MQKQQTVTTFLFTLLFLLPQVFADTVGTIIKSFDAENLNESTSQITAQEGIAGAVLIISGICFLFFGLKLFKPTLAIAGFYTFAMLSVLVLVNIEKTAPFDAASRNNIYLITGIIVGILGGVLAVTFWKVGLVAIGGLGGFALATWFLTWGQGGVITDNIGRPIFIAILVILGVIAAFLAEKHVIILGTSLSGAYALIVGVDLFADLGFTNLFSNFLANDGSFVTTSESLALTGTYIAIVLIGIIVQYKVTGKGLEGFSRKD